MNENYLKEVLVDLIIVLIKDNFDDTEVNLEQNMFGIESVWIKEDNEISWSFFSDLRDDEKRYDAAVDSTPEMQMVCIYQTLQNMVNE